MQLNKLNHTLTLLSCSSHTSNGEKRTTFGISYFPPFFCCIDLSRYVCGNRCFFFVCKWTENDIVVFMHSVPVAELRGSRELTEWIRVRASGERKARRSSFRRRSYLTDPQPRARRKADRARSRAGARPLTGSLSFAEARTHGVGYYSFSTDEEERLRQQEQLRNLRKETLENQAAAQEAAVRKKKQMQERLRAARRRKRERLGLPPEEDSEGKLDGTFQRFIIRFFHPDNRRTSRDPAYHNQPQTIYKLTYLGRIYVKKNVYDIPHLIFFPYIQLFIFFASRLCTVIYLPFNYTCSYSEALITTCVRI